MIRQLVLEREALTGVGRQWLIYIPWHFPLHSNDKIDCSSKEPELEFANQYPVIFNHLLQYKDSLLKRNKAEIGLRYEWYALQRFGANYYLDFDKPKIVYPELTKFLNFTLDIEDHYYTNNKNFILTGQNLFWLTAFFNSTLWAYCFRDNFPELLGGTRELRKVFFEQIAVKKVSEDQEQLFIELVLNIIEIKKSNPNADTSAFRQEIDHLVYELYGLTEEEIRIVEGNKN